MDVARESDGGVARIAGAIGEPARVRILYCLMDGRARSSTELAVVAEVSPSTTSVHLTRLMAERLVKVTAQGKHRYYSLRGPEVARVLEGLSVLAGSAAKKFEPTTPVHLRAARSCYDHMAGGLGVGLHDRLRDLDWLRVSKNESDEYEVTAKGAKGLGALGVDIAECRAMRRRFACACLDWSERRPHVGGAVGAALLELALKRRWVARELDSRALSVTRRGEREMLEWFGLQV
jgi:DNA-binding transcriptional ArsR family regulator